MQKRSATALLLSTLLLGSSGAYAQTADTDSTAQPEIAPVADGAQIAPADSGSTSAPAAADAPAQDSDASSQTESPPQSAAIMSDGLADVVGTLSPLVEDVQIVGPWRDGDQSGVWRAVMARDPADPTKSEFFIQQIAPSANGAQIARSLLIDEVGALGGAVVGYTADEPTEGQEATLTLFFEIVPLDGEISETYQLIVQPDGSYEFGFASN